jgi:hypothetical protein
MPDGTRQWTTIVVTEAYPTSSPYGDHGFTGINLDPSGQFLYFSGGSRTSFGEVESNSGNYTLVIDASGEQRAKQQVIMY